MEWDLAEHAVRLRDSDTGADLSAEVGQTSGDVALGPFLLGIGLEEFRNVCWLPQQTIGPLRETEELQVALQQAVSSISGAVGTEEANELLKSFLSDELGIHSGHLRPLRGKRYARLLSEREGLEEQLNDARSARESVARIASELSGARERVDALVRTREEYQQRILLTMETTLRNRLNRAATLQEQAQNRPAEPLVLPERPVQELRRAIDGLRDCDHRITGLEPVAERHRPQVVELEDRRRSLQEEIDGLVTWRHTDTSKVEEVRQLAEDRRRLLARDEEPPAELPEPDPLLTRYRSERQRLQALRQPSFSPVLAAAAAGVGVASLAVGAIATPLAFGGLIIALAMVGVARRAARSGELQQALESYGVEELGELEQRLSEYEQRRLVAEGLQEQQQRRRTAAAEEAGGIEQRLREVLDGLHVLPTGELEERINAYQAACARRERLERLEGELARTNLELTSVRGPQEELRELVGKRDGLKSQLRGARVDLGMEAETVEDVVSELEDLGRRADADAEAVRAAEIAEAELDALLGSRSLGDLQQQLEQTSAELREHRARHGTLAERPGDEDAPRARLGELQSDVESARVTLGRLETQVEEQERATADPAELEARIGEIDRKLAAMDLARRAVDIARRELEAAGGEVSRTFAPKLNEALAQNLARITDHRYAEAMVGEDFSIRVVAPETGNVIEADRLSRGTQDQIHLLQRLEVARMLDPTTGEAPLLLDDPFDRFDRHRLRFGLELLGELASERQVILFSEDEPLADAIREVCGDCGYIWLEGPEARAAG